MGSLQNLFSIQDDTYLLGIQFMQGIIKDYEGNIQDE